MAAPIIQLDDRTIGLIAAGEVVERPAQVVKELVENALDAGAGRIEVTVERGGFDRIEVRDDGHGIPADQLTLAVTRHATSKLTDAAGLASIATMGFRGESLASIGMVSSLRLASRPADSDGMEILVHDGEMGAPRPVGMAAGTTSEVRGLFAAQPARLAFQRRPATESSRVVDVVIAAALGAPATAFRCLVDERVMLDTPASADPEERLWDILGRGAERMLALAAPPADDEAPGDERWDGWISRPEATRGRSDGIHVLVNGRPVAPGPFLTALRRGYATRLMVGRHPLAVLHLTLPTDEVDVNVHPTKREIRLRHSWRVLERLERSIAHTLLSAAVLPEVRAPVPSGLQEASGPPAAARITSTAKVAVRGRSSLPATPGWARSAGDALAPGPAVDSPLAQFTLPGLDPSPTAPALSSAERALHRWSGPQLGESPLTEPAPLGEAVAALDLPVLDPLSQLDETYLLAQSNDSLYIVDQHAAHERIRYERLRAEAAAWSAQPLLVPRPVDLSPGEAAALEALREPLQAIGITIVPHDGGWALTSAPAELLDEARLDLLLRDVLQQAADDNARLQAVDQLRDEMAFMRACRGAVKAHQALSLAEMRRLLQDMRHVPNPWACVHGRPTAMRLTLDQLDRHFGRLG